MKTQSINDNTPFLVKLIKYGPDTVTLLGDKRGQKYEMTYPRWSLFIKENGSMSFPFILRQKEAT